ncbi:MAG: hypothetical protein ACJ8BW_20475 [Ktedonobacteraceae bacterium]
MQSERGSRQQAKKIKAFHLVVEGYRLPGEPRRVSVAMVREKENMPPLKSSCVNASVASVASVAGVVGVATWL